MHKTSTLVGGLLGLAALLAAVGASTAPPPAPPAPPVDVEASAVRVLPNLKQLPPLPPQRIDTETLWLARCIYSETKRPEEMELVAWVVRNRVETGYRGRSTYRGAVLDPYQFSAFNGGSGVRGYYSSLTVHSGGAAWSHALSIAHFVRHADASLRPFPVTTRHFYSERSLLGADRPAWADDQPPVRPARDYRIDARRFRFFADVS